MGKRRITLVVDDEERFRMGAGAFPASGWGITIVSVEDVPERNRLQEFLVRVETPALHDPVTQNMVRVAMTYQDRHIEGVITVTEVTP